MLIVANHVTAFDGPLLEYALPGSIRRCMAVAMSERCSIHYRRFRSLDPLRPAGRFFSRADVLLSRYGALHVFPLPRQREFQRSLPCREALDRGFHVLVFPEGARSESGTLARFRPGIGLLVKQSQAAVLPMALLGLGDLKTRREAGFAPAPSSAGRPTHPFRAHRHRSRHYRPFAREVEKLLKRLKVAAALDRQ